MKKCISFTVASTVVFQFFLLLYTFGIVGIAKPPSAMAEISASADFADKAGQQRLHNASRLPEQINVSANDSSLLQVASKQSGPLFAHFEASPWRQRLDKAPCEVGENSPLSQKKEFLLSLDNVVFTCSGNENACDHYYRQCGLEIDYTLYSEKAGRATNEAVIVCRASIVYQTEGGCRLNSEAEPKRHHHNLKHNAEYSSKLSLHFHFSAYEQVTEAQLDRLECRVHPGDYVSRVTH
jgi:hypothetical protein